MWVENPFDTIKLLQPGAKAQAGSDEVWEVLAIGLAIYLRLEKFVNYLKIMGVASVIMGLSKSIIWILILTDKE